MGSCSRTCSIITQQSSGYSSCRSRHGYSPERNSSHSNENPVIYSRPCPSKPVCLTFCGTQSIVHTFLSKGKVVLMTSTIKLDYVLFSACHCLFPFFKTSLWMRESKCFHDYPFKSSCLLTIHSKIQTTLTNIMWLLCVLYVFWYVYVCVGFAWDCVSPVPVTGLSLVYELYLGRHMKHLATFFRAKAKRAQ